MRKLNAKLVEKALPKSEEYLLADGMGLFLRVRPSGAKSWIFRFRMLDSRTISKMTIGNLEQVSLKAAREMLMDYRRLVSEGLDPRQVKAAARDDNLKAMTMQALFDAWLDFTRAIGKVTPKWIKRHQDRWRLHLEKWLGNILARDITRAHLAKALEAMTRQGTREETRKALTTLNLMLDYALTHHFVEQNVARTLKPKDFGATANKPKDRVLSLHEMRLLWKALDESTAITVGIARTATLTILTATAIKILLLTGARRSEVAAMQWVELDLNNGIWHLPANRTKNKNAHTIFLSKLAVCLLSELKPLSGNSKFVFDTGRQSSTSHIHQDTLTGVIARLRGTASRCKERPESYPLSSIKPFSVHDIRRSAATAWGEYLKISPHVIERMLNHQPMNKLVAIYQRAVYADEQKMAWLAWGEMIEYQIIREFKNVVHIKCCK